MKYVKMLGLAAVAAAALIAFVGASPASATVLCSTTTTPCNSVVPVGTKIGFESEESTLLKETGASGETLDTCKKSKMTGELTSSGSSTTNPTGPISTLDWEECTWTTTAIELGKLEITGPLTGTSNGTVKSDAEIRAMTISIVFFGSCVYGVEAGVSLGTLTEGKPATFDLNAVATRRPGSSITCPSTANWSGRYTMTEPASTTIAVESGSGTEPNSVLCSTQESPCPELSRWPVGTALDLSLKSGTSSLIKETGASGETLDTCKESTAKGKLEKAESLTGSVESLTWGSCTFTTTTTLLGKLEVEKLTGTHNGTVKADGETQLTINGGFFGSCIYGVTAGTDMGELKEGKPAALVVNAIVKKQTGSAAACPETANWTGEFTLTEPKETTLSVESGTAVATGSVFCSAQETPCPAGVKWPAATKVEFSLTSGTSALLKETGAEGETLDTCKESNVNGEITNAGSSTAKVTGPISSLTWSSCTFTTTTTLLGKLEVERIIGTHNGTVKADSETKVTINAGFFGSCVYGVTSGTDVGELKEGKPALFSTNSVVKKLAGSAVACPETANWSAEYTLTAPASTTLSVEVS